MNTQIEDIDKKIKKLERQKADIDDQLMQLQYEKNEKICQDNYSDTYWKFNNKYIYIKKVLSKIDDRYSRCVDFDGLIISEFCGYYSMAYKHIESCFFSKNTSAVKIEKAEFDEIFKNAIVNVDHCYNEYQEIKNS